MQPPRRPLVHHGGEIRTAGAPEPARLLGDALGSAAGVSADTLTHGFHTWTARMHPAIACAVLGIVRPTRGGVLDPFSGGGTVPIEAMVGGYAAVGADLNPIAPIVARVKAEIRDDAAIARFLEAVAGVGERSEERVRSRTPIVVPVSRFVANSFEGHVLKELGGLREEILAIEHPRDRDAMMVVLSSILVKLSKRIADSSLRETEKRLRKGLATEIFQRKARELGERWHALAEVTPEGVVPPRFLHSDVRALPARLGKREPFDLVLTSPPYGGTYDYVDHHALRYEFLGVDAQGFDQGEIAARRHANDRDALARFHDETAGYLDVARRLLSRDGAIVLLIGDGLVAGQEIPAVDHLHELAPEVGLELHAVASEAREDDAGRTQEEHLVLLRPRSAATARPTQPGAVPRGHTPRRRAR